MQAFVLSVTQGCVHFHSHARSRTGTRLQFRYSVSTLTPPFHWLVLRLDALSVSALNHFPDPPLFCRYGDAAKFRDMLAQLDRQAKQAAALAAEAGAAADNQPRLRLGQRVVHREQGYRGVVVGWDVGCCESEEWQERAGAEALKSGLRWVVIHDSNHLTLGTSHHRRSTTSINCTLPTTQHMVNCCCSGTLPRGCA